MTTIDYDRYIDDERINQDIAKGWILRLTLTAEELEAAAREIAPEHVKAMTGRWMRPSIRHTARTPPHQRDTRRQACRAACVAVRAISYLRAIGEWPFPDRLTIVTPVEG